MENKAVSKVPKDNLVQHEGYEKLTDIVKKANEQAIQKLAQRTKKKRKTPLAEQLYNRKRLGELKKKMAHIEEEIRRKAKK